MRSFFAATLFAVTALLASNCVIAGAHDGRVADSYLAQVATGSYVLDVRVKSVE